MMISSDGITRDISAEEAILWQPQNLEEAVSGTVPSAEQKLAEATKASYQQGYNDALEESDKKESIQVAKITELLRYLRQPLAGVDEALKQSMLSLAAEMASHIVCKEVGSDLDYYRTQLDQLSDKLPALVQVSSLRLRPEKARELRELCNAEGEHSEFLPEIVDDNELSGDVCLACWQESAIDISLHGRLASIVQSYCGDSASEAMAISEQSTAENQFSEPTDQPEGSVRVSDAQ